jgi:uncharacterized protein (DUF3820 family)
MTGTDRPTSFREQDFGKARCVPESKNLPLSVIQTESLINSKILNMDVLAYLKENYETTEMQHAWRFNGVVDVYKDRPTLFILPEKLYLRYGSDKEFADIAINFLEFYPRRDPFKKTGKGRVSMQEFMHRRRMDNKKYKKSKVKDTDLMPYGVHKGKKMANVPPDYLIWLFENQKCFGEVLKYLRKNEENLRQEIANNKKGIR